MASACSYARFGDVRAAEGMGHRHRPDLRPKTRSSPRLSSPQKAYAKDVMNYLNLNQPDYGLAYKHHFG